MFGSVKATIQYVHFGAGDATKDYHYCQRSCRNGQCGGGGLVRDYEGKFIFAYTINMGQGTSNKAEATALLSGLQWCAYNNLGLAWGETDSLLLAKCVNKEWKPPWNIEGTICDIQKLIQVHGFTISHCWNPNLQLFPPPSRSSQRNDQFRQMKLP